MSPKKAAATSVMDWKQGKSMLKFEKEQKLQGTANWPVWEQRVNRVLKAIGYRAGPVPENDLAEIDESAALVAGAKRLADLERQPGGPASEIGIRAGSEAFLVGNMVEQDRLFLGVYLVDCVNETIQGSISKLEYGDEMITILTATYGTPLDLSRIAKIEERYHSVQPTGYSQDEFQQYVNNFRDAFLDGKQAGVGAVANVDQVLYTFVKKVASHYPEWATREQASLRKDPTAVVFEVLAQDLIEYVATSQSNRKTALDRKKVTKDAKIAKGSALAATQYNDQQSTKGKGKERKSLQCGNCGAKGHRKADCRSKPRSTEDDKKSLIGSGSEVNEKDEKQNNALSILEGFSMSAGSSRGQSWVFDTGADVNVCNNLGWFENGVETEGVRTLKTAGGTVKPLGVGTVVLKVVDPKNRNDWIYLTLKDVHYWPRCPLNLVAGQKLRRLGGWIERDTIKLANGTPIACTEPNSYQLKLAKESLERSRVLVTEDAELDQLEQQTVSSQKERIWHARLGHPSKNRLKQTIKCTTGVDLEVKEVLDEACEACDLRRSLAYRSRDPRQRAQAALDLIHGDVFTLTSPTWSQKRYGILATDDYSRVRAIILVSRKYEVFKSFTWQLNEWQTKSGKQPKMIHIDGGSEFGLSELTKWAGSRGIQVELTAPYQPSENPVAERANRSVFEVARGLRAAAPNELPDAVEDELMETSVWLLNHTASSSTPGGVSPFQAFRNSLYPDSPTEHNKPDLSHVRMIGSTCFVTYNEGNRPIQSDKLSPRSWKGVLVGWEGQHIYKIWNPATKKVEKSPNVVFHEEWSGKVARSFPPAAQRLQGRQLKHHPQLPGALALFAVESLEDDDDEDDDEFGMVMVITIPTKEALKGVERQAWLEAMNEEIGQLVNKGTLQFEPIVETEKKTYLTAKWVLNKKTNEIGEVVRFKARLVARGFQQEYGVNYSDTYASTAKAASWRILLADAVVRERKIRQYDAVTAFLNGKLKENVMMWPFEGLDEYFERFPDQKLTCGYDSSSGARQVIRLMNTLYGLKQSAFEWQQVVKKQLDLMGFKPLFSDDAVFRNESGTIVASHVDDFLVTAATEDELDQFEQEFMQKIELKKSGEVKQLLGAKIDVKTDEISISMPAYLESIVKEMGEQLRVVATPMTEVAKENSETDELIEDQKLYQKRIGQLGYAVGKARPDIAFAWGYWARQSQRPTATSHQGVKRILRYLQGTLEKRITYHKKNGEKLLTGWSDASYGTASTGDGKSTTGWVFTMAGGPVSWSSKKQPVVAQSSCEAELIALNSAAKEGIWIRTFLREIDVPMGAVRLLGDNEGSLVLAKNPSFHQRSKHINIRYQYIRQEEAHGRIKTQWVGTKSMAADGLTKALSPEKFNRFLKLIGMDC